MSEEQFEVVAGLAETSEAAKALQASLRGPRFSKYSRFIFAALGSVPWVGGFLAAGAAFHAEQEQAQANELIGRWLGEHEQKINDLNATHEPPSTRLLPEIRSLNRLTAICPDSAKAHGDGLLQRSEPVAATRGHQIGPWWEAASMLTDGRRSGHVIEPLSSVIPNFLPSMAIEAVSTMPPKMSSA